MRSVSAAAVFQLLLGVLGAALLARDLPQIRDLLRMRLRPVPLPDVVSGYGVSGFRLEQWRIQAGRVLVALPDSGASHVIAHWERLKQAEPRIEILAFCSSRDCARDVGSRRPTVPVLGALEMRTLYQLAPVLRRRPATFFRGTTAGDAVESSVTPTLAEVRNRLNLR